MYPSLENSTTDIAIEGAAKNQDAVVTQNNGWQIRCNSVVPWELAVKPQISLFAYPNIAGPSVFFSNRKETEADMDCYFRRLCIVLVVAFIACRLPSMLTYLHFIPFYAAATSPCQKLFHFACNIYFVHAISMFMFIYQRIIIQKKMKRSKNYHPFLYSKFQSIQIQIDQGIPGWPWVPELPGHSVSV